jgi:hypothetical protein
MNAPVGAGHGAQSATDALIFIYTHDSVFVVLLYSPGRAYLQTFRLTALGTDHRAVELHL